MDCPRLSLQYYAHAIYTTCCAFFNAFETSEGNVGTNIDDYSASAPLLVSDDNKVVSELERLQCKDSSYGRRVQRGPTRATAARSRC